MSNVYQLSTEEIKYALDNRRGLPPACLTEEALEQAGCLRTVCALPKDFKERASYLGNVLTQMTSGSNVKDERLRLVVSQLSQALSYMLNSTSWQDGELHDFDLLELRLKLGQFV